MYGSIEDIVKQCHEEGLAVSIKVTGKEQFISGIQSLKFKEDLKLVQVTPYTLYGRPLEDTIILLAEIEKVTPLFLRFNDPFYARLRKMKSIIKSVSS